MGIGDQTCAFTHPCVTSTVTPTAAVATHPEKSQQVHRWLIHRQMRSCMVADSVRADARSTEAAHKVDKQACGNGPVDMPQCQSQESTTCLHVALCHAKKAEGDSNGCW